MRDKGGEVLFHCLVSLFRLAVGFGMESGGQARQNSETRTELSPKVAGNLGASIGDDVWRETMVFPYML